MPSLIHCHRDGSILLRINRLKHQQRSPQIPSALPRNPLIQTLHNPPPLLLPHLRQYSFNILLRWCRHSHQQCPTPDRCNDPPRRIRHQNQPQIGTILLHSPPQRTLRISREAICLIHHDHLEALLCAEIDLLRLRDLLEQLLHDDAVVVAHVRRCDLEMVHGRHDVEFELAVRRGLEDARVDLDLLRAGAEECF